MHCICDDERTRSLGRLSRGHELSFSSVRSSHAHSSRVRYMTSHRARPTNRRPIPRSWHAWHAHRRHTAKLSMRAALDRGSSETSCTGRPIGDDTRTTAGPSVRPTRFRCFAERFIHAFLASSRETQRLSRVLTHLGDHFNHEVSLDAREADHLEPRACWEEALALGGELRDAQTLKVGASCSRRDAHGEDDGRKLALRVLLRNLLIRGH
mmetsp:Transcript_35717/g.71090  ORF Transcript_35717/g.71090 Transcript_35717/m.71090 type:complete len:210 (+) Transcript_35717:145-774(+)